MPTPHWQGEVVTDTSLPTRARLSGTMRRARLPRPTRRFKEAFRPPAFLSLLADRCLIPDELSCYTFGVSGRRLLFVVFVSACLGSGGFAAGTTSREAVPVV